MGEFIILLLFWTFVVIPLALTVALCFTVAMALDWAYTSTKRIFKHV